MHVAIIMDGNGRWAARRGLPRPAGHAQGVKAVRRIVEAAARSRISTLTLYAFSCDNWQRPAAEVGALLGLLLSYLRSETRRCKAQSVRLSVIGRRDRLDPELIEAIAASERETAGCEGLHLRIAVDYSARHAILKAVARAAENPHAERDPREFGRLLDEVNHAPHPALDVDLLIRTGGEKRLSDFLLWECAYAELYFTDCLWPDFDAAGLADALRDFAGRQRRFGRIPVEFSAREQHAP